MVFELADHPEERQAPGGVYEIMGIDGEELEVIDPMTGTQCWVPVENFDPVEEPREAFIAPDRREKLQELEEGDPVWIEIGDNELDATRIESIQYEHFDEEKAPKGYLRTEEGTVISMLDGEGCIPDVECRLPEGDLEEWTVAYEKSSLVRQIRRYDWSEEDIGTLKEAA